LDNKRLDGWKEIADHLGRDVRTCQRWEMELELPIYRVKQDSTRSKVFSYAEELDSWFNLTLKNKNNGRKKGIQNKKWVVPVLLIIVVVAVVFGLFSFVFNQNDQSVSSSSTALNPARWDIKGSQIVVYNIQDVILWTREIKNSAPQESYYIFELNQSEPDLWLNKRNNRNKIAFSDIDSDEKNEIIMYLNHEVSKERCVTLFDDNGQEIWSKRLEFDQEYREGRIVHDYKIVKLAFEDIDKDGKMEILVLWNHERRFPSIFLIYDARFDKKIYAFRTNKSVTGKVCPI